MISLSLLSLHLHLYRFVVGEFISSGLNLFTSWSSISSTYIHKPRESHVYIWTANTRGRRYVRVREGEVRRKEEEEGWEKGLF